MNILERVARWTHRWATSLPEGSRRRLLLEYTVQNRWFRVSTFSTVAVVVLLSAATAIWTSVLNAVWASVAFLLVIPFSIGLTFYVIFYLFWFRWYEQTGGKLIMQLTGSFEGLVVLTFVAMIADPDNSFTYQEDAVPWRPLFRLLAYLALTYSVLRLDLTLISRYRAAQLLEFSVEPRNPRTGPTSVAPPKLTALPPSTENSFVKPRVPSQRPRRKR